MLTTEQVNMVKHLFRTIAQAPGVLIRRNMVGHNITGQTQYCHHLEGKRKKSPKYDILSTPTLGKTSFLAGEKWEIAWNVILEKSVINL